MDKQQQSLNDEGRQLWDQKAAFWDELHGDEGNVFHRVLIGPAVEALLDLQPGERVLDIACGNGVLARRLAELGGDVLGVDFSPELIKHARARSTGQSIDYQIVDATNEEELAALGEGQFPAIVSTMALMDMPVIMPLYRAVRRLLTSDGRFVFATAHPTFNSNNPVFFGEYADIDGRLELTLGIKLSSYLDMPPVKGVGAPDEPAPHIYYHRPLHELLGQAFDAGLVLDGLLEPAFEESHARQDRLLSWLSFSQIPPVMAARLRLR